jgi:hypothetical protein
MAAKPRSGPTGKALRRTRDLRAARHSIAADAGPPFSASWKMCIIDDKLADQPARMMMAGIQRLHRDVDTAREEIT